MTETALSQKISELFRTAIVRCHPNKCSKVQPTSLYHDIATDIKFTQHLKIDVHGNRVPKKMNNQILYDYDFDYFGFKVNEHYFRFTHKNEKAITFNTILKYHSILQTDPHTKLLLVIYNGETVQLLQYCDERRYFDFGSYILTTVKLDKKYNYQDIEKTYKIKFFPEGEQPIILSSSKDEKIIIHSSAKNSLEKLYQLFKVENLLALQEKLIYSEKLFELETPSYQEEKVYLLQGRAEDAELFEKFIKPHHIIENVGSGIERSTYYFSKTMNIELYQKALELGLVEDDKKLEILEEKKVEVIENELTEKINISELIEKLSDDEKRELLILLVKEL